MQVSNLTKGRDGGGVRWFLDGEPIHAGTGLEILLEIDPEGATDRSRHKPLWVPVRFETDLEDRAFIHWPNAGQDELRSEVRDHLCFRWPHR